MPDYPQWGVRFRDGSVRHCWNGRTQEQRARDESSTLQVQYPRDGIVVVSRASADAPWEEPDETASGLCPHGVRWDYTCEQCLEETEDS